MFEREDPYGLRKRLEFADTLIAAEQPATILEIGCGTGALLLHPLAERFPNSRFLGIDSDIPSIEYAQKNFASANLDFAAEAPATEGYDLIIASEVLEHVDQPLAFLIHARSQLNHGGKLFLTIPNGYGAFELVSTAQILLDRFGIVERVVRLKRQLAGRKTPATAPMTLAASPHVNFFSYGEIRRLIAAAGFTLDVARNRTWLCGFLLDLLISRLGLNDWNARIADRLPPALVADWMFVLAPTSEIQPSKDYQPGLWAKFRRYMNQNFESGSIAS